jgi:TolB-like protein/DNA-binding winged helix-turn-helix (wHTH) protein
MAIGNTPPKPSSPTGRLRLGEFLIDLDRASVFCGLEERRLRPKSFDVLTFLAERPRRVASKAELIAAVWPDSSVTDNSLVQCLQEIRRSLGDDSQQLIRTLKGRGYILEADVVMECPSPVEPDSPHPEIQPDTALRPRRRVSVIATAMLLSAVAVAVWLTLGLRKPDRIAILAVLPFQMLESGPRDESLELGMADALITRLSSLKQLNVRPTSSIRQFSATADPVGAGRQLRVGAVVDGSVQKAGDRIRISVRLVRVADGRPLWANTYDEPFGDIFSVQDAVSAKIASALSITLSGDEADRLNRRYTANTEAYQLYLRGKLFWERRTEPDLRKAMSLFEEAAQKDPRYPPAYAALANCYGPLLQGHVFSPIDALPKMEEAIRKALDLDENLAEAHTALAAARFNEWDFPGAERESQRAMRLSPGDTLTHRWYAYYLGAVGRYPEQMTEARRSLELDPLSGGSNWVLASALSQSGRYRDALEQTKATIEINPHHEAAPGLLASLHARMGQYALAREEFLKLGDLLGLAGVEAQTGNREQAQATVSRFLESYPPERPLPQLSIASIYALLGNKDEAFRRLELAYREHDSKFLFIKSAPELDPLRLDPRFSKLLLKAGL